MKYKIQGNYLTLIIDEQFANKNIESLFTFFCLSRKTIHLLKQNHDYALNNKFVTSDTILKLGDSFKIKAFDNDIDYLPEAYPLEIVYEDDFILVVNKPINTAIYPETKDGHNTLCNYVANYYLETNQYYPIRHLHRLDQDTTGLVLFCKCSLIQPRLDQMMANKQIKRYYLAIAKGIINKDQTINTMIARDRHQNKMRVAKKGQSAITEIKVLFQNQQANYTVVSCSLHTGRKHQIRVHLSSLNHPLLSDPLYGIPSKLIKRTALHAYKMTFVHPITNQHITITTKLPDDFKFIPSKKLQLI